MPGYHDPNRDLIDRVARLEARVSELSRSTGQSITAVRDKSNNIVFTPDVVGGHGIARPWIPYYMHPTNNNLFPKTSVGATTPQVLWMGTFPKQHPAMRINVGLWPQGSDATGFARITVNDVQAWPDLESRDTGWVVYYNCGPIALPGDYMDSVVVRVSGWLRPGSTATNRAMALMVRSAYGTELENPEDTDSETPTE